MKISLYNAYNPDKISVDISKQLKNKIMQLILNRIYKIATKTNTTPARLYDYFIYQNITIPLNKLIEISREVGISFKELEKGIILYKQKFVPLKNSVKKPNLPIKITPYLTSIVSNLYFDGSVPESGKGTYYNQKKKKLIEDFMKRIDFVFGEVDYSLVKDHRGVWKLRVPRIIGEICKQIYSVETFGTFNSILPKNLSTLGKDHKISFLLAAILDEGSIAYDGTIQFGVSNKRLCEEIRLLAEELNLRTSPLRKLKNKDHYYFYIKSKKSFLYLIDYFKKKYPLLSLDYKEERLRHYFITLSNPGLRTQKGGEERKAQIINLINRKEYSINDICRLLLIPPRTIRRHLFILIKQGKVKRRKFSNYYLYISTEPH